jgi:hypothetical protein
MNIFVTSLDPVECAQALDDKRLVKMPLESAQMLCTALINHGIDAPYRSTHKKHPCTVWTSENRSNFLWHVSLLEAMGKEFEFRYGKTHKSARISPYFLLHSDALPVGELQPFPRCDLFKSHPEVVEAYRETLRYKWLNDKRTPKWTRRDPPSWK